MSITNRRSRGQFAVAAAWQTAFGTAASASSARFFVATSASIDRGSIYIDPQGTTGQQFTVDTMRKVARRPRANLIMWGAKEAVGLFLESATMGKPKSSPALVVGTASDLSNFILYGVRPGFNTEYTAANGARIYVVTTVDSPSVGQYDVKVYSDSALTQLVASGSAAYPGTVTLSEQNNSGLSGSIDVSGTPASHASLTYECQTVELQWEATPSRYFTLWLDDGHKQQQITDCVVANLSMSSADEGPLEMTVEIWGGDFSIAASSLTPAVDPGLTVYSHHDLTFRTDVDGTPVTESPTNLTWTINNNLGDPLGSATKPATIFNRIHDINVTASFEPSDEFETIVAMGEAGTWDKIDATYTVGSKSLVATWNRALVQQMNSSEYSGDDVSAPDITWMCREQIGTTNSALVLTYQP